LGKVNGKWGEKMQRGGVKVQDETSIHGQSRQKKKGRSQAFE